jgi:5,10-methylenetetrahydrofolate reductase
MPHPAFDHPAQPSFLTRDRFSILCEIEPPTRPDIEHVREQIDVLGPVTDAFVVPDNHLGRATVSSIAVAHEVAHFGGRAIACINARDRNLLGLQRDLLTAAAYGVDHFLLVHGDEPTVGTRSSDVTVHTMLSEVRDRGGFRAGTVARVDRPLVAWKHAADFLVVQLHFDVDAVVRWRQSLDFAGPVYAGVLVLASPAMARRIATDIAEISVPDDVVAALDADPMAGVELACAQVEALRSSGAVDGVHLVSGRRFRDVAARLTR